MAARSGFGSGTLPVVREIVGRTFSITTLFSLICGVTLITSPTGTVCGVVVIAFTAFVLTLPAATDSCAVKYTMLSTTFITAVWLFNTINFGLDNTLTSPYSLSRLNVTSVPFVPVYSKVKNCPSDAGLKGDPAECTRILNCEPNSPATLDQLIRRYNDRSGSPPLWWPPPAPVARRSTLHDQA